MIAQINVAADFICSKTSLRPKIGLVLGSGLGSLTETIENPVTIPYNQIPHFRQTSVEGHQGHLLIGKIEGVPVAVMQGRIHFFEGATWAEVIFPTRVLGKLGITTLILTNAAGGVNTKYRPGDLVLIDDHINMMGDNPLIGANINEFGPRFPDMTYAYDPELKKVILKTALKLKKKMKKGVYAAVRGPSYEAPAEIRMLRKIGADLIGMSTVPEAIAANHMGLKVAGISCVTNMAAGILKQKLSHDEVKLEANKVMAYFSKLLRLSIKEIGKLV